VSPSPLAPPPESAPAPEQERVLETRLSGFTIHAMVLGTLPFAPSLRAVPGRRGGETHPRRSPRGEAEVVAEL